MHMIVNACGCTWARKRTKDTNTTNVMNYDAFVCNICLALATNLLTC